MPTTYKPINSNAELNTTVTQLFPDEAWVKEYFENGRIEGAVSAEKEAFSQGMNGLLRGLFDTTKLDRLPVRIGLSKPSPVYGLNIYTYPYYVGEGRLDVEELREIIKTEGLSELKLRENMGDELYSRFEAIATGLINGIADKERGKDAYSTDELTDIFSDDFIKRVYLKGNQKPATFIEAIRAMNVACGDFPSEDLGDALPYDKITPLPVNLPQAIKEVGRD